MQNQNESLEALSALQSLLEETKESNKKRGFFFLILGGVLLVWLSVITITATNYINFSIFLDWVHVNIEKSIPSINESIKTESPESIRKAAGHIVQSLPLIYKAQMTKAFEPAVDAFAAVLAQQIKANLSTMYNVTTTQHGLSAGDKGQPINLEEHNKRLLAAVHGMTQKEIEKFYLTSMPAVQNFKAELHLLKEGKGLDEDQKFLRKIIGAWLSILDHKGAQW